MPGPHQAPVNKSQVMKLINDEDESESNVKNMKDETFSEDYIEDDEYNLDNTRPTGQPDNTNQQRRSGSSIMREGGMLSLDQGAMMRKGSTGSEAITDEDED